MGNFPLIIGNVSVKSECTDEQASFIKGFTEITENKLFSGYPKSYFR